MSRKVPVIPASWGWLMRQIIIVVCCWHHCCCQLFVLCPMSFVVGCCSQTAVAKLNVVKIPTKQNEAKHHDLELSRGEEDSQHWPCIGQTRSWELGWWWSVMIVTMMMAVIVFLSTKRNIYKPRLAPLHCNKRTDRHQNWLQKEDTAVSAGPEALTIEDPDKNDQL